MSARELIPWGLWYSSPGCCTEKLGLFEARDLSPCEEVARDEDEIIEVVRVAKSEAVAMVMDGRICDGKTIALLMRCLM